ncbi:hypothetical protein C8R46DRAFT_1117903 [Mycena filopes]|nr:hypothetical protein C8R46DRAFT_1117903 [Mycena filopes]
MTSTPTSNPPLSVDGLLHAHASAQDPKLAALEQAITERLSLKTKNEQLWKLIEKQRSGYNQLIQELERMRAERDAYKTKLTTAVDRKPVAGPRDASAAAGTETATRTPSTPRARRP